jgi:RNA polymerase-interacting CarD/CdnL/TRCF family regulator
MFVLDFAAGLSVTLPLERALECLRPLAGETEMACVGTTLREDMTAIEDGWLKRSKATQTKVTAGQTVGLAEVVRDSVGRDRRPAAHGRTMRLSPSEQQLYLKARQLLADEIGIVRGIESSEADDWISDQLSHTPVKRSNMALRRRRTAPVGL